MELKRVLLFVDFANINRSAIEANINLDYAALKDQIAKGRELVDAFCYMALDPRSNNKQDLEIEHLQQAGYVVITKKGAFRGETFKCNMDIEIAIDIIKMATSIKPDAVVLMSGDGDFVAVIDELRRMGIRAEVVAFQHSMSKQLRLRASGFIDLEHLIKPDAAANGRLKNKWPIGSDFSGLKNFSNHKTNGHEIQ